MEYISKYTGEEIDAKLDNIGTDKDMLLKTDIVNDLTTGGTDKVLSAEQGKQLGISITEQGTTLNALSTTVIANKVEQTTINESLTAEIEQLKTKDAASKVLKINGEYLFKLGLTFEDIKLSFNITTYSELDTIFNDVIAGKYDGFIDVRSGIDTYTINNYSSIRLSKIDNSWAISLNTIQNNSTIRTSVTINESNQSFSSVESSLLSSSDIVDNLTSDATNKALSAAQGKYINDHLVAHENTILYVKQDLFNTWSFPDQLVFDSFGITTVEQLSVIAKNIADLKTKATFVPGLVISSSANYTNTTNFGITFLGLLRDNANVYMQITVTNGKIVVSKSSQTHITRVEIEDNLNSTNALRVLSANQGRVLNNKITELTTVVTDNESAQEAVNTELRNAIVNAPGGGDNRTYLADIDIIELSSIIYPTDTDKIELTSEQIAIIFKGAVNIEAIRTAVLDEKIIYINYSQTAPDTQFITVSLPLSIAYSGDNTNYNLLFAVPQTQHDVRITKDIVNSSLSVFLQPQKEVLFERRIKALESK